MKLLTTILLLILSIEGYTQDSKEIMKPINDLFLGMNNSDTLMIKSVFSSNPSMRTVVNTVEYATELHDGSLVKFLNAIGNSKKGDLAEPIWNPIIKSNEQMATVWVDYAFYYKGKFSHCGVDLFDLAYIENKWLIFNITDTRSKTDCKIPETVRNKYEK